MIIEFEDMSPEAQKIVTAGDIIAGTFPTGMSRDELIHWLDETFPIEAPRDA